MKDLTEGEIRGIIEGHLATIQTGSFVEIGFYGGSFTGIDRELQINYLSIANDYIKANRVNSIRLSTRPDYISESVLAYLKKFNVGTIELGAQSLDEEILGRSCRGHGVQDVITSSQLIRSYGFELGIQTMVGLPGDTAEKAVNTAKKVIELKPSIVRIYPTLVIKDTYLEKLYRSGNYFPLPLEVAVDICAVLLGMYGENGISVIRVGLQATENINTGGDIAAGPFHPAFRQLVEARLALLKIEGQIAEKNLGGKKELLIHTKASNISNVIGQKRNNIAYLKEKYGFNRVIVSESTSDYDINV